MKWFRRKITPSEAAKVLSTQARNGLSNRELVKAKTRELRQLLGLPPLSILEPKD